MKWLHRVASELDIVLHNINCLPNFQLNKRSGKLSDWNKLINPGMNFNRNQTGRGKTL